jgi:hypothetical protein
MKLIAHRGNIFGSDTSKENSPDYIDEALSKEFDVEIDIRFINEQFYLGHDTPDYKIDFNWIISRSEFLWIHCKDLNSLNYFSSNYKKDLNYFWHQNDDYTLTSKNCIWVYPGKEYSPNSIVVMPEIFGQLHKLNQQNIIGVCSDFVGEIK